MTATNNVQALNMLGWASTNGLGYSFNTTHFTVSGTSNVSFSASYAAALTNPINQRQWGSATLSNLAEYGQLPDPAWTYGMLYGSLVTADEVEALGGLTLGTVRRTTWPSDGVTTLASHTAAGLVGTNEFVRRLVLEDMPALSARVPKLGMNTWWSAGGGCTVTAVTFSNIVTKLQRYKPFGFTVAELDDYPSFRTNGVLQAWTNTFPGGLEALAAACHAAGLEFGLYWQDTVGTSCSPTNAGGRGYAIADALRFHELGVRYVKLEAPYDQMSDPAGFYNAWLFLATLRTNAHPVYVNMATMGFRDWYPGMVNSYRVPGAPGGFDDIGTNFTQLVKWTDYMMRYTHLTRPGFFPDLCFIPAYKGYARPEHFRTHLNLCAILPSSIMTSETNVFNYDNNPSAWFASAWWNDLEVTNAMRNAMVLDSGVFGARLLWSNDLVTVYQRKLLDDPEARAVCLLNRATSQRTVTLWWTNLQDWPAETWATVVDVERQRPVAWSNASYTLTLPAESSRLFKLYPGRRAPQGVVWLSDGTHWAHSITNGPSFGPWNTRANRRTGGGDQIYLGGSAYTNGIGTSCNFRGDWFVGGATRFLATVGMDSQQSGQSQSGHFFVLLDGQVAWHSGGLMGPNAVTNVDVAIAGQQTMTLLVTNGNPQWYDWANWANARLVYPTEEFQLGVGTSTPQAKLHVVGDGTQAGLLSLGRAGADPLLLVNTNGVLIWATNTVVTPPALSLGSFALWNSNGMGLWLCRNTNNTVICTPLQ